MCIRDRFTVPFKFDLRTTVKSSFYNHSRNTSRRTQWYINIQLNSLNESELRLVEGIINAIIENRETEGA